MPQACAVILAVAAAVTGPAHADPSASILAGTVVTLRIDEPVSSKTHKTGDWFAITLAEPVMQGDAVRLEKGIGGRGQVVHAAKAGWGGKAGELVLAARYLESGGIRIALRGMKLGGVGKSNSAEALAAGIALTPLPFVITGTSATIDAGHLATAKLAADFPARGATEPATGESE